MHLLSSLLFALSANIDNFTVGIASNLLIAFIAAAGTSISMAIGIAISKILTPSSANILGSVTLMLLGVWIA